ncbi:hypothetical protein TNIN_193531 [Trichonephila inaurata madagascariensis]|uniref:Uncharacterized protein n=1 Tax=Trichonephila inaurata madagascariensis TaxID=2747483 RepID=A0A8X6Y2U0_9ARAC|nr:hypothetical protein TNIN_193531 [Trichonephila inaurata madagascariensis]
MKFLEKKDVNILILNNPISSLYILNRIYYERFNLGDRKRRSRNAKPQTEWTRRGQYHLRCSLAGVKSAGKNQQEEGLILSSLQISIIQSEKGSGSRNTKKRPAPPYRKTKQNVKGMEKQGRSYIQ